LTKKLVTKDEQLLLEEEQKPDKPGVRQHFNRYSNINMKMKISRK
jgi:hypothetical protein